MRETVTVVDSQGQSLLSMGARWLEGFLVPCRGWKFLRAQRQRECGVLWTLHKGHLLSLLRNRSLPGHVGLRQIPALPEPCPKLDPSGTSGVSLKYSIAKQWGAPSRLSVLSL